MKKTSWKNEKTRRKLCWKPWDISNTTARIAPELLKALEILWDTTVRRSAVDHEDLKP